MNISFRLLAIIWLAFALIACGGDEANDVAVSDAPATREPTKVPTEVALVEAPTALPEPTATPLPAPTATAMPEPTDEPIIGTPMRFDEIGLALVVPEGWDSAEFFGSAFLTKDGDEDNAIIVFAEPLEEGATIDSMFDEMQSEIGADENVTFGDRVELSVNGLDGFEIDFTEEAEGVMIFGRIAFLTNGTQAAAVVGRGTPESWDGGQSEALSATVQSISLYEPVAIEEAIEAVSEEVVSADSGQEATEPADGTAAPSKNAVAAPIAVSGDAGMACFGASGEGMSCISAEGEWQTFTEETSSIPSDYIIQMVNCSEETILIAHSSELSQFDGETFRRYDTDWGFSSPDDMACDAEGGIWAAHFEGVSYYDGSAWTTWDSDTYFAGDSLVNSVKVAPDGKVWMAASNTIASYDGSDWTLYEEADFGELFFFDTLSIDSAGVIWATTSDGLLYSEDGGWTTIDSPSYFSAEILTIEADGSKWIGTFNNGIELFKDGAWQTINRQSGGLGSDRINDMLYDGSNRLWIATDYGLAVRTGGESTFYRMDNAPLISNAIRSVAVLGGGPVLPELMTFSPGGIKGVIVEEGASVANRAIEICVQTLYGSYEGETPCEDQPLSFSTRSDENGAFIFTDVPVGRYVLLVQTADGWNKMTNEYGLSSEMVPVADGEVTDIGDLDITE